MKIGGILPDFRKPKLNIWTKEKIKMGEKSLVYQKIELEDRIKKLENDVEKYKEEIKRMKGEIERSANARVLQ